MKKSVLSDEIQYVKEYFVTQNDEVIKIAAICPKEKELVSIESFKNQEETKSKVEQKAISIHSIAQTHYWQ